MSTVTPSLLYQGAVPTTAATAATVPGATTWLVSSIDFSNTTTGPITAHCWVLPVSGSIVDANAYFKNVVIIAGAGGGDKRTLVLPAGYALAFQASASGLNVFVNGAAQT